MSSSTWLTSFLAWSEVTGLSLQPFKVSHSHLMASLSSKVIRLLYMVAGFKGGKNGSCQA